MVRNRLLRIGACIAGMGFIASCGARVESNSGQTGVGSTGGTGSSTGSTETGASGSGPQTSAGSGVWIAFDSAATLNRDVYVVRPDGSDLRRLTTELSADVQPTFSPDGHLLAFASDRSSGVMQIHLLDLATGKVSRVTNRPGGATNPAFSPDGTRIGYRGADVVYVAAIDGTDERAVTTGTKCCFGPFGPPVFAADGQGIVYDDYNAIYEAHLDGTAERTIVPPTTGDQSYPTLSPDGASVALQASCGDGVRSIWMVPFGGITALTCRDASSRKLSINGVESDHPAWGPDGSIVWDSGPGTGSLTIWKDGVATPIPIGGSGESNPTWSPVGTAIP